MEIELRKLVDIKPYDNNPRRNDDAVDAVAASLKEFGFRQPIVVDGEGVIICGHTRYKAALKLGLEKVPVHVAKDLSPEQARAYRLADNKTHDLAEWDEQLLSVELSELIQVYDDQILYNLGFDDKDIYGYSDEQDPQDDNEETDEKDNDEEDIKAAIFPVVVNLPQQTYRIVTRLAKEAHKTVSEWIVETIQDKIQS